VPGKKMWNASASRGLCPSGPSQVTDIFASLGVVLADLMNMGSFCLFEFASASRGLCPSGPSQVTDIFASLGLPLAGRAARCV
jgi:hypothetical protein